MTGTAATLNAGDSLDGGAGQDTLQLFGAGSFDLNTLAGFTGFEHVDLVNITGGETTLRLGAQDLSVSVTNSSSSNTFVYLGGGTVSLDLGTTSFSYVYAGAGHAEMHTTGGFDRFYLSDVGSAAISFEGGAGGDVHVAAGAVTVDGSAGNSQYVYISNADVLDYTQDSFAAGTDCGSMFLPARWTSPGSTSAGNGV